MKKYEEFVKILAKKTEEMKNFHKKIKTDAIQAVSDRLDYLGVKELTLFYYDDIGYEGYPTCYYSEEDLEKLGDVIFYHGQTKYNRFNVIRYVAKDDKGTWVANTGPNVEEFYLNETTVTDEDILNLLEYLENITPEMIEKQKIGEESDKFNL